jgi:hypothetical protein
MGSSELFILLGIIGVIVAVGYFGWKQERDRTVALSVEADRLGWDFYGSQKNHRFDDERPQFKCFQEGHARYAHNGMIGKLTAFGHELPAEAGDYHYQITSGSGKNRSTRTYRFSYLLVNLPFGPRLPSLVVRPEGFFDKLAGAVGFEDIDFESAEFSKRYHVSSSDRRFTYNLIDPRMIEFLLDEAPPRIELGAGTLLIVADQAKARWEPREFVSALHWTTDFLSHWPEFMVHDLSKQ